MTTDLTNLHAVQKFTRTASLLSEGHVHELATLATAPPRTAEGTAETEKNCGIGWWEANFGTAGKSFVFAGGIAVIPVYGALLHKDNWCMPWATGYDYIRSRFAAALGDDEVKGIVFDINSYGGHVAGNFELAREIFEARSRKPTLAMVDNKALSGGYSLAASCGKVIVTESADVGSIGVMLMHTSIEEYMKKMGVETTFVYAGKHKVDGNMYNDLPKDVKAAFQSSVDRSYAGFVSLVSEFRGIEEQAVRDTEAAVFGAEEAKSLGLIDDVMPPRAAYASFLSEVSASTPAKEAKKMSNDNPEKKTGGEGEEEARIKSAKQEGASEGQKAATARIGSILNCEEAKGKSKLANHLAFESEMSAEDAKKMLAVAAAEKPEPDEEENKNASAGKGLLSEAMKKDANRTAGVEGDEEGDGDGEKPNRAARIVANYKAATGRVVDKK
jgi:signal peptide peptidase SppA